MVRAGRYGGDSCLVMPHQTSILAQVAQAGNKTSERKQVYDMSANQRYVDYKLNPSICVTAGEPGTTGGTDTTDVTIEVDLPEICLSHIKKILPAGEVPIRNRRVHLEKLQEALILTRKISQNMFIKRLMESRRSQA